MIPVVGSEAVLGWLIGVLGASPVILHLTETANVPPDHPGSVVLALVQGIESSTGRKVVIDDVSTCTSDDECIDEAGARFTADDIILLRLVGAVRTGRALVSLGSPRQGILRRIDLEYPLEDRAAWPAIFSGVGTILFPGPREQAVTATAPPPVEEASLVGPVVSWTAIGLGVALGAAATGLRVSANAAGDDAMRANEANDRMAFDEAYSRARPQGIASNVLFGAAAVAVASGVVYLLTH